MCGIVGAVGKKIDKDFLHNLFISTESRGRDATGFWSPKTGIVKGPEKVSEFLTHKQEEFKLSLNRSNVFVGHVRWATHGDPAENRNNHPLESENWILVHNGVVHLPPIDDYPYTSETDTEEILAHIEHHGLEEGLANIDSGAAIILVPKNEPNTLLVWRTSDGAMVAAYDEKNSTIYISSGSNYVNQAQKKKKKKVKKMDGFIFEEIEEAFPKFALASPKARELWKLSYSEKKLTAVKLSDVKVKKTDSPPPNKCQPSESYRYHDWWNRGAMDVYPPYLYSPYQQGGGYSNPTSPQNPRVKKYNRNSAKTAGYITTGTNVDTTRHQLLEKSTGKKPQAGTTTQPFLPFKRDDLVELTQDPVYTDYHLKTHPDKISKNPFSAGETFTVISESTSPFGGRKLFVRRSYDGASAVLSSHLFELAQIPACFIEEYMDHDRCEACGYESWCGEEFWEINGGPNPTCLGLYLPEDQDCVVCSKLVLCLKKKTGVKSF